ncbi:MAG: site-2 protease family protein, partial [bacterium]
YGSILLHELSHGMACKRFGRKVRAFGLLLYYGLLCAYVDTTETWMVKERWKRALVSLAGPLATLTLACLFHWGEYFSLMAGWEITARAFDLLALISFTSALLNLLPVLELDGYYALADLLDQPNLRRRSFAYVEALLGALGGRGKAPTLPWGERLLFLGYAIASLAILLLLIGLPLYNAMRLALGGQFTLGALVSFLFALMLFVQALAQAGMGWYRKRYLTPLDLKAIA